MYKHLFSTCICSLAIGLLSAVPAQATILNITPIGEFDGPSTNGVYPQPSLTIGTFTYTIPAGDVITSASVSGFFGTTYSPSTALENLYVAGVKVASCSSESDPCWADPSGVQTAWSYTFTPAQFAALQSGSAVYSVVQTGDYYVESGVTTLSINVSTTPEPATVALLGGGLALLPFLRRKFRA